MLQGIKHLVRCRCILPQFQERNPPIFHEFIVFSVLDDGNFREHFAQCNNCGIAHRVKNVNVSEILNGRENVGSLVTIDDLRASLDDKLVQVLDKNQADLATWQAASFIIDNERWGDWVVLNSETIDAHVVGKAMVILGKSLIKIENFERSHVA